MNWVPTVYFLAQVIADITDVGVSGSLAGVLQGCYCGLFQAPTPFPTPGLTIAGITECNYTGYARQLVSWFPPWIDALGPYDLAARNMHFVAGDSVIPNTATGVFLASSLSGGNLLLAAMLVAPALLSSPLQALDVAPVFQVAFTANYGRPLTFA
jgi:hypothetical protein